MTMLASQITSLTVVYSIVYSGVNQRKHQSSASLAFVREIHRGPVNFPHKWPVTRKMFPFDDVIMSWYNDNSWVSVMQLFNHCCEGGINISMKFHHAVDSSMNCTSCILYSYSDLMKKMIPVPHKRYCWYKWYTNIEIDIIYATVELFFRL